MPKMTEQKLIEAERRLLREAFKCRDNMDRIMESLESTPGLLIEFAKLVLDTARDKEMTDAKDG